MSPDAEEYHATMLPENLDEIVSERIRQAKQQVNDLREKILEKERNIPPFAPLSRRDWFAGMAMGHVIPNVDSMKVSPEKFLKGVVLTSIEIADAMLTELDEEGK